MFSKRPGEHVAGTSAVALCIGHVYDLLEDGGSN